jgi:hypothetical protein
VRNRFGHSGTARPLNGLITQAMKTLKLLFLLTIAAFTGCSDQAKGNQIAKDQADAKTRSEALKKEMETAPKVFSNRDIFKKNEPGNTDVKTQPTVEKKP